MFFGVYRAQGSTARNRLNLASFARLQLLFDLLKNNSYNIRTKMSSSAGFACDPRMETAQAPHIALRLFRATFESVRPLVARMTLMTKKKILAEHCLYLPLPRDSRPHALGSERPAITLYSCRRLLMKQQGDEMSLAEQAAKAIDIMLSNVKERNSQILRVFKAAGDAVTQDKDFLGLKKKW
ncbi:hypothetical protein CNMCM5793_006222 [Aspergillus hiratsukae]|uniref:Uncharacterized protein n=1 Tax=Aspergillus hiratsukae TaxID=1194566 RepID=A0A8H6PUN3_9EURO|nr:hypothetical protein CNMCM5793_006222 [Aspergillus hiratsukae]KAF7160356.1 hypothetical protein CNMCM6106_007797 [Aspergillus hiratsukae]